MTCRKMRSGRLCPPKGSSAFPDSASLSRARCRQADRISGQFETVRVTSHEPTELVLFLRPGSSRGRIRAGDLLVPSGPVTHCQPRAVGTRTVVVARDPSRIHREGAGSAGQRRVVAWGCRIVHRDNREALSVDVPVDSSSDYVGRGPFAWVIIPGRGPFLLCATGGVILGNGGTH